MDMITDIQQNNDAKDYETMANYVHKHGSKHGYNVIGEQDDGMPMHGHGMMGKGHKMADMEHMQMQMHPTLSLKTDSDFLIEGIKISSVQGIVLAMVFTIAITILLDSLKIIIYAWEMHKRDPKKSEEQTSKRNSFWRLFVTGTSHMLSVSLGYIMMLCVMTMNVWLIVSVVLGSGIAHFIIRPLLSWKLEGLSDHSREYNTERTAEEAEPFYHRQDFREDRKKCENNKESLLLGNNSLSQNTGTPCRS